VEEARRLITMLVPVSPSPYMPAMAGASPPGAVGMAEVTSMR